MLHSRTSGRKKEPKSAQTDTAEETLGRGVYKRKDGRELRRMAVYLPVELARALMVRCAEQDSDVSYVVAEAVEKYLRKE